MTDVSKKPVQWFEPATKDRRTETAVLLSNVCPKCGGILKAYQVNRYIDQYALLPDGRIDESSAECVENEDGDAVLTVECDNCGLVLRGYRCGTDSQKFEFHLSSLEKKCVHEPHFRP